MNSTPNNPYGRRRWFFISTAILFILAGATAWLSWALKANEIITDLGATFTILGAIFTILGVLSSLALYKPNTPPLPVHPPGNPQSQETSETEIESLAPAALGVTKGTGAFIIYTDRAFYACPINLTFGFNKMSARPDMVEYVVQRKKNGRTVYVCLFRGLSPSDYTYFSDKRDVAGNVSVEAGKVKEVDCRKRTSKRVASPQQSTLVQTQKSQEV